MNIFTVELKMKIVVTADNPGDAVTQATQKIRNVLKGNGPAFLKVQPITAIAYQNNRPSLTRRTRRA